MIIRENGIKVGLVDNETFEIEVEEHLFLSELLEDALTNGIEVMHPGGELQEGQASADTTKVATKEADGFIWFLRNALILSGFDVQMN